MPAVKDDLRPPMTDAQRELALTAINLAFRMAIAWYERLPDADGVALWHLCRAAQNFNPGRGTKFTTLAGAYVQTGLRHEWLARCAAKRGDASRTVLACDLGGYDLLALPDPGDDPRETVAEEDAGAARRELLAGLLGLLTDQERLALRLRFWGNLTLEEAGREMGVSKERVRQVQDRALWKMRKAMREKRSGHLIDGDGGRPD